MVHPPKKAKAGPKLNVVDKQGNKVDISSFDFVGLYFSAHWCPPCKAFTPVLAKHYQKWKKKDESIEIVFISSDGDEASANNYYAAMPWARLVYDQSVIEELGTRYGVDGIPNIQIWNGDLSKKMTDDARSDLDAKKAAAIIDWKHMLKSGGQCNEFEEENSNNSEVMTPQPASPRDSTSCIASEDDVEGLIFANGDENFWKGNSSGGEYKPIKLSFNNATDEYIVISWVNYDGELVDYHHLSQDQFVSCQDTYTNHQWVFRFSNGDRAFASYTAPTSSEGVD